MEEEDGGSDLPDRVLLAALAGDACAMRGVVEHYVRIAIGSSLVASRSELDAKLRERVPNALARWAAHCENVLRQSKVERETARGSQVNMAKALTFSSWFVRERRVLELDRGGCRLPKKRSWPETDVALVQSAVLGDRAALVALIKVFQAPVFEMLGRAFSKGRFLGDRGPEDLAQEVFLKLMKRLNCGEQMQLDKLSQWVRTITKNLIRDEARRKERQQRLLGNRAHDEELREPIGPAFPEHFFKTKQQLEAALSELPKECSDALLRSADGESLRDIAKSCGVNHNTLRSRADKARRHLRRQLRRQHYT